MVFYLWLLYAWLCSLPTCLTTCCCQVECLALPLRQNGASQNGAWRAVQGTCWLEQSLSLTMVRMEEWNLKDPNWKLVKSMGPHSVEVEWWMFAFTSSHAPSWLIKIRKGRRVFMMTRDSHHKLTNLDTIGVLLWRVVSHQSRII